MPEDSNSSEPDTPQPDDVTVWVCLAYDSGDRTLAVRARKDSAETWVEDRVSHFVERTDRVDLDEYTWNVQGSKEVYQSAPRTSAPHPTGMIALCPVPDCCGLMMRPEGVESIPGL